jgi:hypothetical protein
MMGLCESKWEAVARKSKWEEEEAEAARKSMREVVVRKSLWEWEEEAAACKSLWEWEVEVEARKSKMEEEAEARKSKREEEEEARKLKREEEAVVARRMLVYHLHESKPLRGDSRTYRWSMEPVPEQHNQIYCCKFARQDSIQERH